MKPLRLGGVIRRNISTDAYIVVTVSKNTNSFGLRGMIVVNRQGRAWTVAANALNVLNRGDQIVAPLRDDKDPEWWRFGFEIPRELPPMLRSACESSWANPTGVVKNAVF